MIIVIPRCPKCKKEMKPFTFINQYDFCETIWVCENKKKHSLPIVEGTDWRVLKNEEDFVEWSKEKFRKMRE